jgi:glycosyltransferase involved in cell wall biosynthesis
LPASTSPEGRPLAVIKGPVSLPDRLVILAIATEWDSSHGGLSTLNRELCVALAKLGHQVYCGVPRLLEAEVRAARASGVVLVAPDQIPGTGDDQALNRPLVGLPKNVDVVIGHGRKTGGAALAQVHYCGGRPKYIHFVHMDPHAIEWSKKADDRDREATRSAQERVDEEVAIGSRAALIVAVGPELRGAYATYFHHLKRSVYEFLPGLFASDWNEPPAPDYRCLVFGRAEDRELKGVNFAADAMHVLSNTKALRLAWLVIRGAPRGTGDQLRADLEARVGAKLRILVQEYTADRDEIVRTVRSASLVLMPSREEGFGLTGLEAISEGVPVLLSRTSGLAQALEERLPKLALSHVIDVQDGAVSASTRMKELLLEPEMAHERVISLREAMCPIFNWERSARELVDLIRATAASATGQSPPPSGGDTSNQLFETFKRASSALLGWRRTLRFNNEWLDRPELAALLAHAREKKGPLVLLGKPGSGKSALLAKMTSTLHDEQVAVLAIKADRLPANVDSRDKLAEEIGLPADLGRALRASAELRPTVLVIDQMDALGDLVDEQTQRLSVLLDLIGDLTRDGVVAIVLSCRSFDFRHDVRFQRLDAATLELQPPDGAEIDRVLEKSKVDPLKIPPRLKELLKTVQALDSFLELKPDGQRALMESHQQLLDVLWRQRIGEGKDSSALEQAARQLASYMADKEELWLSWPVIEEAGLKASAKTLVERGLLVEEEGRVAFAHQTLFDFGRARAFLSGPSLSEYVRQKQDALFVRPALWTSLGYLRSMDPSRYIEQLETLWLDPKIRAHIHSLLVEFVGQVPDPREREVALLVSQFSDDVWRPVAIDAVADRRSWFELLSTTHFPALMRGSSGAMMTRLLQYAYEFARDAVLELVQTYWMPDTTRHPLVAAVLAYAKVWPDKARDLALTLVRGGTLDRHTVEAVMRAAIAAEPVFAPKLIGAELVRLREAIKTEDPKGAYRDLIENVGGIDCLVDAAAAAPREFVAEVWPWFVETVERVKYPGTSARYGEDYCLGTSLRHVVRELAQALSESLASWATQDTDGIAAFVAEWRDRDSVAVHRFLIMALEAGLPATRAAAVDYLVGDERRLNVGDSSPMDEDSSALIRKLTPHLSEAEVQRLQTAIAEARSIDPSGRDPEDQAQIAEYNKRHRLRLLRELGKERLPDEARAAIEEFEASRRGEEEEEDELEARFAESPLTVTELLIMGDDEILKFFEAWPDSRGLGSGFIGGSVELSRSFAEAAKRQPDRFLALLPRFTPNVTENPVGDALESLAEVLPLQRIEGAIVDLHNRGFFRSHAHQRDPAYALERAARGKAEMQQPILDLLESWLVDDVGDDARRDERVDEEQTDDDVVDDKPTQQKDSDPHSLLWALGDGGVLPGGNYPILYALTMGYLRREKPDVERWFEVLDKHLERRERPAVWNAMRRFLGDVLFAPAQRVEPFLDRLFEKYPGVREAHDGLVIIARAMHRMPGDTITRWLEALEAGSWIRRHQAYGELLVLFATRRDAPSWTRERLERELKHYEASRSDRTGIIAGVAFAASNLWKEPERRSAVTDIFVRVIKNASGTVAKACMDAFRGERALLNDTDTQRVLSAMTAQPAVVASGRGFSFFEDLQDLLPGAATQVTDLLLALVAHIKGQSDRTFLMSRGSVLVDTAMTLQRLRSPTRERGLDLFEQLLSVGVYEAREVLSELDPAERSGPLRPPRRTRTPRRRHRAARPR